MLSAAMLSLSLTVSSPAVAISVHGLVEVDAGSGRNPIKRFDEIAEGAKVITGDNASVQIRTASGSVLRLGAKTEIDLSGLSHNDPAGRRKESVKLVIGRLWARVTKLFGNDSKFEVQTRSAVAGVRGTSFVAEAGEADERFVLLDGILNVSRGPTMKVLDRPGAFLSSTTDAFGDEGVLDANALNDLRRQVGGAGASVTSRLGALLPKGGGGPIDRRRGRRAARKDINGPDQLVDTPLGLVPTDSGNPSPTTDPAIIEVEIILDSGN